MGNKQRVAISSLNSEEAHNMTHFIVGEEYKVSANTPHFIVNQGRRVVGMVVGMNGRAQTRVYNYDMKYRPNSEFSALGYYDF